ncbi:MAG: DUF4157 domain-containing protein, partial [Anaerolineales bacterium]|nr:DUF4157 domain-containing protein [Anaerolineales bacterium]
SLELSPLNASDVLQLQRTVGNQAGQRLLLQRQGLEEEALLQGMSETEQRVEAEEEPLQEKSEAGQLEQEPVPQSNRTGLPDDLKAGAENLSGVSMDQVKVHYNSAQPTQVNALAYTQGADIHVAPGQEQHLPHEAWHVVQQAQGRVKPTAQVHGAAINDSVALEREAEEMGQKAQSLGVRAARGRLAKSEASGEVVQRISWDDLQKISALGDAHKLKLYEIAKAAGIVPSDSIANIFAKLVAYGHANFAYESGQSSFKSALLADQYNCESISHLLIHLVVIMKGDTRVSAENVTAQPLLYKGPLEAGGFNNQAPNNVLGQTCLVFTNGHTMAKIDGSLYDPTTGVSGGMNADYIQGALPGPNQYRFILGGNAVNMRRVEPPTVIGGLWQFEVY